MRRIVRRIVELQSGSVLRRLTDSRDEFEFLEALVERTKRPIIATAHHYLVRTPYRYPVPVRPAFAARFTPPYSRRLCSYYAFAERTAVYEYAFHWLRQRVHVQALSQNVQWRTCFEVAFADRKPLDISNRRDIGNIMNRRDYSYAHAFIMKYPHAGSVIYPSCRDPKRKPCVAVFEINLLGKMIRREKTLGLVYDASRKASVVVEALSDHAKGSIKRLEILWDEVS